MNYEDAVEARVTLSEVKWELKQHGITAVVRGDGTILDDFTGEVVVHRGKDGLYKGGEVLAYLGY